MFRETFQHPDQRTADSVGFVFYDPYYEELLNRKRQRDLVQKPKEVIINTWTCSSYAKNAASSHHEGTIDDSNANESFASTSHEKGSDDDVPKSEMIPKASEVGQLERAMHALYQELDRQKLLLAESMQREAGALKELANLRRKLKSESPSRFVTREEFTDLEAKYINTLQLVDALNWRLNSLPDETT